MFFLCPLWWTNVFKVLFFQYLVEPEKKRLCSVHYSSIFSSLFCGWNDLRAVYSLDCDVFMSVLCVCVVVNQSVWHDELKSVTDGRNLHFLLCSNHNCLIVWLDFRSVFSPRLINSRLNWSWLASLTENKITEICPIRSVCSIVRT